MPKSATHPRMLAAVSLSLMLLAGCQTGTPTAADDSGKILGQSNAGDTQTLTPKAPGDTTPVATQDFDPDKESGIDALASAKAMTIKASEGGQYVSEDGKLKAVIPPGVLSGDAELRFAALDTTKIRNTDKYMSGIGIQADFGDAYLKPDTQIIISAKADPRFVSGLQAMYKSEFKPELFALVQDEKGEWFIEMPIKGPASKSPESFDFEGLAARKVGVMIETGFLPILPEKGHSSPYVLQQFAATSNRIEAYCYYAPPPPPPVACTVHASWLSDDPTLNGKDAAGAVVRFESQTWNTPNEIVANASGNVTTYIRQGWSVPVYGYIRVPCPGVGPTVNHTAGQGGATEVQVPKYSPRLKLAVTSQAPMNGEVTLEYTLDGQDGAPVSFPVTQGATSANFEFFLRVPDDNAHSFKISRAYVTDSVLGADTPTLSQPAISIKRNCVYDAKIHLESVVPK